MKTVTVRRPGQPGTKRLHQQFGSRLICVRYRYDEKRRMRLKAVELVIDEQPWIEGIRFDPPVVPPQPTIGPVMVPIGYQEKELRRQAAAAGGKWLAEERVWQLDYEAAVRLGLEKRIKRFL